MFSVQVEDRLLVLYDTCKLDWTGILHRLLCVKPQILHNRFCADQAIVCVFGKVLVCIHHYHGGIVEPLFDRGLGVTVDQTSGCTGFERDLQGRHALFKLGVSNLKVLEFIPVQTHEFVGLKSL